MFIATGLGLVGVPWPGGANRYATLGSKLGVPLSTVVQSHRAYPRASGATSITSGTGEYRINGGSWVSADPPELVTNGTFDTDISGWSTEIATISWDSAGKLLVTNIDGYDSAYQIIPTVEGQIYFLSVDTSAGTDLATITVRDSSSTGILIARVPSVPHGTSQITFTARSASTAILLQCQALAAGTNTLFDNVSVKATENLVDNGEFSRDYEWTLGDGLTIASGVAAWDGTQTAPSLIFQALANIIGATYRITFDVVVTAGSINAVSLGGSENLDIVTSTGLVNIDITALTYGHLSVLVSADFIGSIDNVSVKRILAPSDYIEARQTSSGLYSTDTELVLDIAGVADTFTLTTISDNTDFPYTFPFELG